MNTICEISFKEDKDWRDNYYDNINKHILYASKNMDGGT